MQTGENHERLFECGVTDGVKIQMVKDEDITEEPPKAVEKVEVDNRPISERAFDQL
jgi:hypothetical protein